jgi:protein subunit release factor A
MVLCAGVCRSKLHELEMAKQAASLSAARQAAAGSRNYNERIRSYYLDVSSAG